MKFRRGLWLLGLCGAALSARADERATPTDASGFSVAGAIEAGVLAFPAGPGVDAFDVMIPIQPILALEYGEVFSLELGAPLRIRLYDTPPLQRPQDVGRFIRGEDWDERSDFGQIVRQLQVGDGHTRFEAQAGALLSTSVGRRHLFNRYSNQEFQDYHPAGVRLVARPGAFEVTAIATDALALRIFALDVSVELGSLIAPDSWADGRFAVSAFLGHDQGDVKNASPSLTVFGADTEIIAVKGEFGRLGALAGFGIRADGPGGAGGLFGVSFEADFGPAGVEGRFEIRSSALGFRHAVFGPGYELSRLSDVGFHQAPLASVALSPGLGGYGELKLRVLEAATWLFGLEVLPGARVDLNSELVWGSLSTGWVGVLRYVAAGLGQPTPRHHLTLETRARVLPSLYVFAVAGTAFISDGAGGLGRGVMLGGGLGVDFDSKQRSAESER